MVQNFIVGTPTGQKHEHFVGISYLIGLDYKGGSYGISWDIPILIFAYVLFWGPIIVK